MQATGEAVYIDDMPLFHNELFGAFVFSTVAHANITAIDFSAALKVYRLARLIKWLNVHHTLSVHIYDSYHSLSYHWSLQMPGVVDVITSKDVQGDNHTLGAIFHDEEVFSITRRGYPHMTSLSQAFIYAINTSLPVIVCLTHLVSLLV